MTDEHESQGARGGDVLTILVVAAVLLLSEVVLRSVESSLSGNIAHISEIPELASEFDSTQPNSVAIIGNSLANYGFDLSLLRDEAEQMESELGDMVKLVPDATTIWSWSCIIKNQFQDENNFPDTVVIPFAWNQLSDQSRMLPSRLGAFFCGLSDLAEIDKHQNVTSSIAGEYLLAKSSRTYAHRETIRNRVLSIAIPQYEALTQSINRQQRQSGSVAEPVLSYYGLTNLVNTLTASGARLVVVAMPVRDNAYELDPGLLELVTESSLYLLDYRDKAAPSDQLFVDDMHLAPDGAAIVSKALAADLIRIQSDEAGI